MRHFKLLNRKSVRGISLLEVMLSLSIIAIILVMATRYFFTASERQRVQAAKADVTVVVAAASTYGHNKGGVFTGLTISNLISSGYLDKNNANITCSGTGAAADCHFKLPWNTEVEIVSTASNANVQAVVNSKAACEGLQAMFPKGTCAAAASGNKYTFDVAVVQTSAYSNTAPSPHYPDTASSPLYTTHMTVTN